MARGQIKIKDNLYLCRDKYQWWFAERFIHKDGGPRYDPITGYFRELSGAFEDLEDKEKRIAEGAGVPELIEALEEHKRYVHELAMHIEEVLRNEV